MNEAFDSVSHGKLLEKLVTCGIKGKMLDWIYDFLNNRKMRVRIRGAFSDWAEVVSGVPQGSVLGPLLFLCFVNDLPDWVVSSIRMFADDTKIWTKIETAEDSQTLQRDLDKLAEWSERWLLRFNPDKCKVMHIGHKLGTEYKMTDQGKD
jgi:ribonuclease P/MRP protein subunit RPP40